MSDFRFDLHSLRDIIAIDMIDIEKIKPEIIKNLKSLEPDKIVLFGSYAYGKPDEDSDIDLFIFKDGLDAKRQNNI